MSLKVMSGTRHHYIPQFLQAGFASKSKQVWVYNKKEPYFTSIKNTAVENHFYDNNDPSLDNEITKQENDFSNLIKSVRENPNLILDPTDISRLISHFQIRTRHIRLTFLQTSNLIITNIIEFIKDDRKFIPYFCKKIKSNPTIITKYLGNNKKIIKSVSKNPKPWIKKSYRNIHPEIIKNLSKEKDEFLKIYIKDAHIKGLQESIKTYPLSKNYASFKYHVYKTENLILGDSIVLFETDSIPRNFCAFPDKNNEILRIYLPLSSSKILVGYSDNSRPPEDFSNLNKYISKCSYEFFISENDSIQNRDLVASIGTEAMPLTDDEIEDLLTNLFDQPQSQPN